MPVATYAGLGMLGVGFGRTRIGRPNTRWLAQDQPVREAKAGSGRGRSGMTVPFRPVPETGPDLGAAVNANSRASGVDTKRGITAGAVVTISEGAHFARQRAESGMK